jgi:HK97 family phage portal protein
MRRRAYSGRMGLLLRDAITKPETRNVALINPSTLTLYGSPTPVPSTVGFLPETALGVPAVYAAVRMISRDVASMPWDAYLRDTNQALEPEPTILRRPDPWEPVDRTRAKLTSSLLLRGNAFAWLTAHDRSGRPTSAIPISYGEVAVTWNENQTRPVYRWRGRLMRLGVDILHAKYLDLGPEYLLGLGPIQAARTSLSGALYAEQYAQEFYSESGIPDGVLTAPGALTEPEATLLEAQWTAAQSGRRKTAVLPQGVTWEPVTMNNADAQYIESRQFSVSDIARLFGIPGGKLGAVQSGSSLTYTNLESLQSQYATDAVRPVSEELESQFGDLLPRTQEVRFDFRHLIRADTPTRYNVYETALRSKILTPNEVRRLEGLPPLAGGDQVADNEPAPVAVEVPE